MLTQIVDDSPNMREAIKAVLSGMNARFIEADDGDIAITQYSEYHPDFVIMDIRMGKSDGISAARAIHQKSPKARIFIVTQYNDNDLRVAAREAGASAYILKDDLSDLLTYIQQLPEKQV